jgi:hypothetical protein
MKGEIKAPTVVPLSLPDETTCCNSLIGDQTRCEEVWGIYRRARMKMTAGDKN